jgi:N-acetylmuramoyl-L-alanine amidase
MAQLQKVQKFTTIAANTHDDDFDDDPLFPPIFDSRISTSWFRRASRSFLGDPASEQGLWYPPARRTFHMPTQGNYEHRFPMGAVVHSTDGRSKKGDIDAENTIPDGITHNYAYFCISSTGTVYQSFLLDRWGSHCGPTSAPGLGTSLARKLVGIEVCAAGIVHKSGNFYEPEDWDEKFTEAEVHYSDEIENVRKAGYYVRFTAAQETALTNLILWMHKTKPDIFKLENIYGHDEVATPNGRKNDPGAAMSVYMNGFRQRLKDAARAIS